MKIQIQLRDIELSKAQREKVELRLERILVRYAERIERLTVRLAGRGEFAQAVVEVKMKPKPVRAEHTDPDVFVALDAAAQRVGRSVARAIAREGWWEE